MAVTLTTSYQKIGSVTLSGGSTTTEARLYAKYNSQSTANNTTSVSVKLVFYRAAGAYSFYSATGKITGGITATKSYSSYTSMSEGATTVVEKTSTITHNTDGSKSISLGGSWKDSYLNSSTKTITAVTCNLPKIARGATIDSAPNFNDEENPTITYNNPAGTAVTALDACIAVKDSNGEWTTVGGVEYRAIETTGTSFTFNLTDEERDTLRGTCSNSNTLVVGFHIRTTFDTTVLYSIVEKTLTIVNADPTATITKEEANTTVTSQLGSSGNIILKGWSNLKVQVNPTLKKQATLRSITISNANASNSDSTNPYTFNKITDNNITYTVTDSRGNMYTGTLTPAMVNYVPVTIESSDFSRKQVGSNAVVLNAEITAYNGAIGSVTNSINLQVTGASIVGETIPASAMVISGNKITITEYELSEEIDEGSTPTLQLMATDLFSGDSASNIVSLAVPTAEMGRHDFQVNGELYIADENRANAKEIRDLIYPVGSIYMSVNDIDPGLLFGGTWARIQDAFLMAAGSTYAAGSTGGSATKTIGVNNMPSHTHTISSSGGHAHTAKFKEVRAYISGQASNDVARRSATTDQDSTSQVTVSNGAHTHTPANTGGGEAMDIMPPYLSVYVWQRTA